MAIRWIAAQFVGLIAMAVACGLHASDFKYDAKVFAFLPEWCKYTLLYEDSAPGGRNVEEGARWKRLMGPGNFRNLHHYCAGLFLMTRALYFEKTKAGRDAALKRSLGEYDYTILRVEPTFPLLPEILTKKGETLVMLGLPEAMEPLHQAISLRGDYWPAYAALSDYFANLGNAEQARQWLQKGLEAAPNATALARRLAELNSKTKNVVPKNGVPRH
jgi:tetratricopeptide (TPR) repeat protein